ncbi:calpain-1 catalytic subunit-like isoform X1 [Lissotriton helveticus]
MAPLTVRLVKKSAPSTPDYTVNPYLGQKYQDLRQQCLRKGQLFEDPYFPASPPSLGYSKLGPRSEETQGVSWKRPQEICQLPQFVSQDMSRTDVCQGILGNCWFLAAAASLSLYPRLMDRVVPPGQNFQESYAGIFHFQFWQYGQWVDVVIDDRLPVKDGKLVFLRSPEKEEFWAALLEKAYAKLNGSYEVLEEGLMNEAFVDFTGGIGEHINLKAPPAGLFHTIRRALQMRSLMGASLEIKGQWESEVRTPEGLVKGHAYSVTGAHQVENYGRTLQLLRLRNPWGKVEWNGRWSDKSSLWSLLDPAQRTQLQVEAEDGEFWMQMEDFLCYFDTLELCNLTPDSLSNPTDDRWNVNIFHGRWVRGYNAGGCRNHKVTFWTNPQFHVDLLEVDGDKEPGCTMLVSLTQRDRRQEKRQGMQYISIGFEIFQIPPGQTLQDITDRKRIISSLPSVTMSQYVNLRDVTLRCTLKPGCYLIIPSTFEAMAEAKFTLRIFTEKQQSIREFNEEIMADDTAFKIPSTPQCDDEAWQYFKQFAGQEQQISAPALQQIMNKLLLQPKYYMEKTENFPPDSCQLAIALVDVNGNGKLGLSEFKQLWSKIRSWELIFSLYDADQSGSMDAYEIRLALKAAGFHLNNRLTEIITRRYGDELLRISLKGFLSCLVLLETTFRKCRDLDKNKDGVLQLTREEWVELSTFA